MNLVRCNSNRARETLLATLKASKCSPTTHYWSMKRTSKGVYEVPSYLLTQATRIVGVTRTNPKLWEFSGSIGGE